MRGILRFAENLAIEHHFRIRRQYRGIRDIGQLEQARAGFLARHAAHVVARHLARHAHFRHINVDHLKRHAESGKQFATTRGLRGRVKHA